MKKFYFLWQVIGLCLLSMQVLAGDVYHCVIQDQIQAAYSGKWARSEKMMGAMPVANQSSQQFVVDRLTGRIMGDVFDNQDAKRIEVLDVGSDQQAFKLLAVFGPNISVDYLQIKEYHQQADKPFTGMSQGKAYAGMCHRNV
jgi:hypothetical protein